MSKKTTSKKTTPKLYGKSGERTQPLVFDDNDFTTPANFKSKYVPPNYVVLDKMPDLDEVWWHDHFQLFEMLTYMRPHLSKHEAEWIEKYIAPHTDQVDKFGNHHKFIPNTDGSMSRVLWSCHTDTVHSESGFQNLEYDAEQDVLRAKDSDCLGADDGTGVYMMLKMIEAGVPGHYLFHRGEECGCLGSRWIVKNKPEILEEIDVAVAFDRKGLTDIITHQTSGKCASKTCALQMAELFAGHGIVMEPSDNGVYTDTAEYNGHVSECFNLAVGYYDQHFDNERQDLKFLDKLLKAVIAIDWSQLKAVRDTTDCGAYGGFGSGRWDSEYDPATAEDFLEAMQRCPMELAEFLCDFQIYKGEIDLLLDQADGFTEAAAYWEEDNKGTVTLAEEDAVGSMADEEDNYPFAI